MPQMKKHESGGIVFVPTKAEREVIELKQSLRRELDEIKKLKEELKSLIEDNK